MEGAFLAEGYGGDPLRSSMCLLVYRDRLGMTYSLIDLISPGSFRYTYDATKRLTWPDYSFFSVVTLTTVGYGDIVPIGGVKGLVMMEAIIGAMYPPILIGRLLTLHARSDGS